MKPFVVVVVFGPCLLAAGCASSSTSRTPDSAVGRVDSGTNGDSGADAASTDAGGIDAGWSDAGSADAGDPDATRVDSGPRDSGPADTGPADTGAADTGSADTGSADTGTPVSTSVSYKCVPAAAGNEMNPGLGLSGAFWPGFRFEVSAGSDVTTTAMQLNVQSSTGGSIFGALVRLTGPSDQPDSPDLTGSDVLATTVIAVPGGSSSATVSAPITTILSPGWYAAVFGTDAFGASLTSSTVHFNSGSGGCDDGFGYPFSIIQSDGRFVLQAATPHFQVDGARP